MKITPSPRILKMLGQIEFHEWQCLAELVDNSIDDLLQMNELMNGADSGNLNTDLFCIEILLPSSAKDLAHSTVVVRDHGRGMDIEHLQMAVRAGWSGNDMFERLGLFGMGFNISTARLGKVTRVLTTREGDPAWIGVKIDLDAIGPDFEAQDITEPKSDPADHGTRVEILRLDPDRADRLFRKQEALLVKLGHIYSWILENTPISLRINGKLVKPKRLCAWSNSRSVTYGQGANRETIPAVITINVELPLADACLDCGNWQATGKGSCDICDSNNITQRERRIFGWVGIQRYLDQQNFGLDFIRNGRKILTYDKSIFDWIDINNPLSVTETEYPVEVPSGQGRIIGEIHLDHVPVHYMKDKFDTNDRSWNSAIEYLRGSGPLKQERAKQLGFPTHSNAPISRLFRGYRRNDPGYRCLIPGDGKNATHQQAAEWGKKFERGDADYQTDEKWWEAVVFHEAGAAARNNPPPAPGGEADIDAVMRALVGSKNADDDSGAATISDTNTGHPNAAGNENQQELDKLDRPLTTHDKVERLKLNSRPHTGLSRILHARCIGEQLTVQAYEVNDSPLIDGIHNTHTAIWLHPAEGGTALLFIDPRHESFTILGIDMLDLALAQIASFMITRSSTESHSISQVIFDLRRDGFPDSNMDFTTVQNASRDIINRIRDAVVDKAATDPTRAWSALTADEISTIEQRSALTVGGGVALDSNDSSFISHTPALYLVRLFDTWPELFMDGSIFSLRYNCLNDASARRLSKGRIMSLLMDVAALASEENPRTTINQLRRTRLSVDMLIQELAF